MKIEPFFNYVVLERKKLESSSIIIPDDAAKRYAESTGIVQSTGPACEEYIQKSVGKEVLFKRHAGDWRKSPDGKEYFVVEEADILGVIL